MARSCKDARLSFSASGGGRFDRAYAYGREVGATNYATAGFLSGGNIFRSVDGVRTTLVTVYSAVNSSYLDVVGTSIKSSFASVTDSVIATPGDWRVGSEGTRQVTEVSFECYDAPAPSGPAHPVIGSGIVNSRAIVRGAA